MILTLILLAAIGVILLAERSAEHVPFAIRCSPLARLQSHSSSTISTGRYCWLSVLAAAIAAASTIKHDYSALKLVVTDLPLMFAGTVPFLYRSTRAPY